MYLLFIKPKKSKVNKLEPKCLNKTKSPMFYIKRNYVKVGFNFQKEEESCINIRKKVHITTIDIQLKKTEKD